MTSFKVLDTERDYQISLKIDYRFEINYVVSLGD